MNRQNSIEYLTGFIMGAILGMIITFAGLMLYNLACRWFGWAYMPPAWWNIMPIPLLLGISMSKIIANLKLGDY